jgi:23S rRNA (adenine2503-C2)-methyltransferase
MIDLLSLTATELESLFTPKFRAVQVYEWLHVHRVQSFDDMTNLPVAMRETLRREYRISTLKSLKKLESSNSAATKYLYELCDGEKIESVFMRHYHGNSVCISSQAGCRMGCKFCASAQSGLIRNLTAGEMLNQVYEHEQVDSIVVMGIGEPLDNFENLLKFLEIVSLGKRHISISTCGLADKIDELATLKLGITLSVSLHAVTDDERSSIMPVNRKFNLQRLLESCNNYFKVTGRRISFEYALISDVNDSSVHARRLADLLSKSLPHRGFHVNLIPVNEVSGTQYRKSDNAEAFAAKLHEHNINATVRKTMGGDINAACGQLRIERSR